MSTFNTSSNGETPEQSLVPKKASPQRCAAVIRSRRLTSAAPTRLSNLGSELAAVLCDFVDTIPPR
jgi:hypothetical protein